LLVYTAEEIRRLKQEQNSFVERVMSEGKVVYENSSQKGKAVAGPGGE
jgi:hypothetical protein